MAFTKKTFWCCSMDWTINKLWEVLQQYCLYCDIRKTNKMADGFCMTERSHEGTCCGFRLQILCAYLYSSCQKHQVLIGVDFNVYRTLFLFKKIACLLQSSSNFDNEWKGQLFNHMWSHQNKWWAEHETCREHVWPSESSAPHPRWLCLLRKQRSIQVLCCRISTNADGRFQVCGRSVWVIAE